MIINIYKPLIVFIHHLYRDVEVQIIPRAYITKIQQRNDGFHVRILYGVVIKVMTVQNDNMFCHVSQIKKYTFRIEISAVVSQGQITGGCNLFQILMFFFGRIPSGQVNM